MDEGERQDEIYSFLERHFGTNVYAGIEFIRTKAPADRTD